MSRIRPLASWPGRPEKPTAHSNVSRLAVSLPPYWANYARTVASRQGSTVSFVVESGLRSLWSAEVVAGLIEDAAAEDARR